MSLLAPLALLGLIILPVIILLHFLRTRREPLLVSNLRLWQGLQQKQQSASLRYLPLSLMLALQLCLAAVLALGLARPAFSFWLKQPQHTIFILDTTSSMFAADAGQRRFEAARQVIETYLRDEMGSRDTFAVIGLNRRPAILLSGDAEQKAQAIPALDNLAPGATGLDLPAALTLANGLLDPDRKNQIIILTDGNFTVDADTLPPLSIPVTWQFIPAQLNAPNQVLLNVSAQSWPDGRHRLFARVVNYSPAPATRTVRVTVDDRPFDEASVELAPQTESARLWTLPASAQTAAVEIVEPDALLLDNRAELFLSGGQRYRILLVSDAPEAKDGTLARALAAQPGVELTLADAAAPHPSTSTDVDLIVLDGQPAALAWPSQGSNVLVVNPPPDHPLLPADGPALDLRPDPATTSPLLTGVDLSGAYFRQVAHRALPAWAKADLTSVPLTGIGVITPTLAAAPGKYPPLIFHGAADNSRVVVWAFDLNKSNLSGRLALPLLTANTMSTLLSTLPLPAVALGEPVLLAARLSVELPDGQRLVLPAPVEDEVAGVFARTQQPGLYQVYSENNRPVGGFAVHAGSALESNLTTRFQPDTLPGLNALAAIAAPKTNYYEVWPWLAGLALVVLTVEGWLAWRK